MVLMSILSISSPISTLAILLKLKMVYIWLWVCFFFPALTFFVDINIINFVNGDPIRIFFYNLVETLTSS